jgi:hypothetical protein
MEHSTGVTAATEVLYLRLTRFIQPLHETALPHYYFCQDVLLSTCRGFISIFYAVYLRRFFV